jgi:hypothetical protein
MPTRACRGIRLSNLTLRAGLVAPGIIIIGSLVATVRAISTPAPLEPVGELLCHRASTDQPILSGTNLAGWSTSDERTGSDFCSAVQFPHTRRRMSHGLQHRNHDASRELSSRVSTRAERPLQISSIFEFNASETMFGTDFASTAPTKKTFAPASCVARHPQHRAWLGSNEDDVAIARYPSAVTRDAPYSPLERTTCFLKPVISCCQPARIIITEEPQFCVKRGSCERQVQKTSWKISDNL